MLRKLAIILCFVLPTGDHANGAQAGPSQESAQVDKAPEARIHWLKQNAIAVRTIDPKDDDFADLMPLVDQIGTARVVALGEQTHGDGATFLAKHRLIRFLHQKMRFDVLAWESGMFDCREMDAALLAGLSPKEAAMKGIFPIWGASGHVLPVVEYAASTVKTGRRLELAGFDCQFSSGESISRFPEAVEAFFDRIDPDVMTADRREKMRWMIEQLGESEPGEPADKNRLARTAITELIEWLDANPTETARAYSRRETMFIRRALENLLVFDQIQHEEKSADPADTNLRDKAMGNNLAWLAKEYYPDRKIIVWAASCHLMREAPSVKWLAGAGSYAKTVPMGHVAHSLLGKDYYSVMFTAYRGQVGNPFFGPAELPQAPEGSLEDLLHSAGTAYAFLDFRSLPSGGEWLRKPLVSRPMGYAPMQADWPNVFDAVFYTEAMFPSTRDGAVPESVRTAKRSEEVLRVAEVLEEYRKMLIGYDLSFVSVFPGRKWKSYDATRLEKYPTTAAWPKVLGHVHTNPDSFRIVEEDSKHLGKTVSGPHAFMIPLDWDVATTEAYATLLFLEGIASKASLAANTYTSLVCLGPMEGKLFFDSYATALVKGDVSGQITSKSYFNLVVTGKFSGRIFTDSYAMIYLLGGFEGSLKLKHSKVYIAGRTTQADLARIQGKGEIYLEDSDLPPGEHKIGDLAVTIAKQN